MIYQVVTPLGLVVFESISRDSCVLYCRKSGIDPDGHIWPVRQFSI